MDILRVGSAIALSMFLAGTAFGRNGLPSVAAGATQKTPASLRVAARQAQNGSTRFSQGMHSSLGQVRIRPTSVYAYGPYGHANYGLFRHGYGYYPFSYGYDQSSYFPYLYFFDHYAREAEESRRAADEYEASLAREGKLTGPEKVGAFPTDYLPFPPPGVTLIFDGDEQEPSPSGAALKIGSGEHSLRVQSK